MDRRPFKFGHRLMGYPALTLENLGRVLPSLPADQLFYSRSTREKGDNLDRLHLDKPSSMSIEATIENLRTSDSYVMVRSPETDPWFAPLHRELLEDVRQVIRLSGGGREPLDAKLYLFIASPGSVTPSHIDRYSTFLMQFRGSKTVSVFPAWDKRVVDARECEDYVA